MSTSVARSAAAVAHPYAVATSPHMATASRSARRASYQVIPPPLQLGQSSIIHMPLPPTPTSSSAAAAAAAVPPPPAYSRRDKPGAETRFAKVDRTANWVAQQQEVEQPPAIDNPSLQSYGYFTSMGSEPPTYSTSPTSPSRMDSAGRLRDPDYRHRPAGSAANLPEGVLGRALARSMADEPKSSSSSSSSSSAGKNKTATPATKAKSVFRKLVGKPGAPSDQYAHLHDESSSRH